MYQILSKQPLADAVYAQLRERILGGELVPGDNLPSERLLCDMLGVNRGAVREGIKRLQESGLVRVRHGGPTQVLDYEEEGGLELLPSLLISEDGHMRVRVARGILSLRESLAPAVARQAAQHSPAETVHRLRQLVAAMRRTEDIGELQQHAFDYWGALVKGSRNIAFRLSYNTLGRTYEKIWALLSQVMAEEFRDRDRLASLAEAVAGGDAVAAEQLAREHVSIGTLALNQVLDAYAEHAKFDLSRLPTE